MDHFMKDSGGASLVEVVASLLILSVLLLTFFNLFVFTNKAAHSSQDKLIGTYLAKATLERVKADPLSYIDPPDSAAPPPYAGKTKDDPYVYSYDVCKAKNFRDCETLYLPLVNGKTYEIYLYVYQDVSDRRLNLINVAVQARLEDKGIASTVEGFVRYEP